MLRSCLSYMLITLIALQSVMAMADIHESHQDSAQHKQANGVTKTAAEYLVTETVLIDDRLIEQDSLNSEALDCNHCCHCHSLSPFFVSASDALIIVALSSNKNSRYQHFYLSKSASPDFRPPII